MRCGAARRAIVNSSHFVAAGCACLLVAIAGECVKFHPVCVRLNELGGRLASYLPVGRMPSAIRGGAFDDPGCTPQTVVVSRGGTGIELSGGDVLHHMVMNRAFVGAIMLLLCHASVCALVLLCYLSRAWPEAIRAHVGSWSFLGRAFTSGGAWAAWASLPFFPLVWTLHRVLWGAHLQRVLNAPFIPLAVGPVGIGLMYIAATMGYVLVTSWVMRSHIRERVRGIQVEHCAACGYERSGEMSTACPECGDSGEVQRSLSTFGLSRLSVRLHRTRWKRLVPLTFVAVVCLLYLAPVVLPVIGSILPAAVLDLIGEAYGALR